MPYFVVHLLLAFSYCAFSSTDINDPLLFPMSSILPSRQRDYERVFSTQNNLPPSRISDPLGILSPQQYKDLNHQLLDLSRLNKVDSRVVIVDVCHYMNRYLP